MFYNITPDFSLDDVKLTHRQKAYVKYLTKTFNVRTAKGDIVPYEPEPYQQFFHAHNIMAKPDAKDRLINKARGIGATMMIAMEDLMMMRRYSGITIPFTSTGDEAAKKCIEWGYWLANNANLDFGVVSDNKYEVILDNGSHLVAIPGGNPKRFRNIRAPAMGFDEFAHCDYQSDILTAARRCMSEGGQATLVSTPIGMANKFWEIKSNWDDFNYDVFEIPMFDPQKFDINTPIFDQPGLKPVAPWIDMQKLEDDRRFDPIAFMQENMCSPQDESVAFLPTELIRQCIDPELYSVDYLRTANPCFLGIDFAYKRNLSAISIVEVEKDKDTKKKKYKLRHLSTLAGADTPTQVREVNRLMKNFPIVTITIDSTGPGVGLYHDLRAIYKYKVKGVNFARKIDISGEKTSIKRALALKLKRLMIEDQVRIMADNTLKRDLNSVPYLSLNAPKSSDLGHGDRFWSLCLAVWNDASEATIVLGRKLTFGNKNYTKPMARPMSMGVNQKW